jgi:dihydroflavonol-4-reductase
MEKILITGANGFIGSNLCRYFLDRSYDVYGLVRKTSNLRFLEGLPVKLIQGDLLEAEAIEFPRDLDYVIHAAAAVSDLTHRNVAMRNIYDATVNLVELIKRRQPKLKRFIHLSSTLVLGFRALNITESRPGKPVQFLSYADAKKVTEVYLKEQYAQNGFPVLILRPSDVFGPNDRIIAVRLLSAIDNGVPPIVGHGNWYFSFCHVDNLALACSLACQMKGSNGKAYTVTNGQDPTWRQLFTIILRRLGKSQRFWVPVTPVYLVGLLMQFLHLLFPSYDPPLTGYRIVRITSHTTYDISETIEELDYRPDQDFEKHVDSIVDWYLKEKEIGRLEIIPLR